MRSAAGTRRSANASHVEPAGDRDRIGSDEPATTREETPIMLHDDGVEARVRLVRAGEGPSIWRVGDTYSVKATAGPTGGSLALLEASIPPGCGPPPHVHGGEDEALYVLAGQLEVSGGAEAFVARAGDFVFIPRATPHSFRNVSVDAARALIVFAPAGFERFFQEAGFAARPAEQAPPVSDQHLRRALELAPPLRGADTSPGGRDMARELTQRVFREVDARDPAAFSELFALDGRLVFANGEPLIGR